MKKGGKYVANISGEKNSQFIEGRGIVNLSTIENRAGELLTDFDDIKKYLLLSMNSWFKIQSWFLQVSEWACKLLLLL